MDSTNSNAISIVNAFDSNEKNLTILNDKSLEDKQDLFKSQARRTRIKLINLSSVKNMRRSSKENQGYKKRKSNEFIEAKNKTYCSKKSNTDENKFVSVRHKLINADNNRPIDLWRVKLNKTMVDTKSIGVFYVKIKTSIISIKEPKKTIKFPQNSSIGT